MYLSTLCNLVLSALSLELSGEGGFSFKWLARRSSNSSHNRHQFGPTGDVGLHSHVYLIIEGCLERSINTFA
jgi:hypothetical protein